MPIDVDDIESELEAAEDAFQFGGQTPEDGLDVTDPGLVQLRKACRSLSGADHLLEEGYYTLPIEAAFTAIEKSCLFWLIDEGNQDPSKPPQSHTTAIKRSASVGFFSPAVAARLEELWDENRAHTYYRNGIATQERATAMVALADRIHLKVVNSVGLPHECLCL
jgi:hypothetical protein